MGLEVGGIAEGKVTGITRFGAFVELEGSKVGLVHISEISNVFVKEVSDHVKEGQTVKVKILGMGNNGKIELSIKQASENFVPKRNFNSRNESLKNRNVSPANSFEDMMTKFKKLSDEKLSDFKKKSEPRRGKPSHKNNV
jgi:S1 RNA binding domain protein